MAELLDIRPVLKALESGSHKLVEARSLCLEVTKQSFDSGSDVAAAVAGRLQRYRAAENAHDPELVQKAETVERQVIAWLPVLVAVEGIVAAVSVDQFRAMARTTELVFAAHRKTVEERRGDIEGLLIPFAERLAKAETREARAEVLTALSADERERLRRVTDTSEDFNAELAKIQGIIEREIVAEAEIAETFDAVRDFLEARQEVLANYMTATDYFSGLEPKEQTGREAGREATKQIAKIGIEVVATKAGPKLLEQVPIVGIVVGGGDLLLEMRRKRKEFHERAEQLRKLAAAREDRGATDEVFALGRNLTADQKNLTELMVMVEALGQWLDGLVAGAGGSKRPATTRREVSTSHGSVPPDAIPADRPPIRFLAFEDCEEVVGEPPGFDGVQLNRRLFDLAASGTPHLVADVITFKPDFIHHMHRHFKADQVMVPLRGSVVMSDETGARRELGVGEAMVVPRYRWHEVRNESGEDCVVFNLFSGVGDMADVGFEAFAD